MYDSANLANLARVRELAPAAMQAFEMFDRTAMAPGLLSRKHKELVALAVALTTQCPYSLDVHRRNAAASGATEAEIAEVVFIVAAMRATAAIAHGTHLVSAKR